MHCSYCWSNLHTAKNCPKTWAGSANRASMRCTYCGSREHNVNACPKTWHGSAKRAWHEYTVEGDFIKDR